MNRRVLIASPIRQKPAILRECLRSLSELQDAGLELHFAFVDDNENEESHALLRQFAATNAHVTIVDGHKQGEYLCNEKTHHWNEQLIWKVAAYKDAFIQRCLQESFDYLFLLDSDLVLPPPLIRHLISLQKAVVSEVFWTRWQPDAIMMPQVWMGDHYTLFEKQRQETLDGKQAAERTQQFIQKLRRPGCYRVGGLGACTLLSREALAKGLSFAEIDNLSFWGEDRHFCIRARALGVELWADTRYPPLHIYRESDLDRVAAYRARFAADFIARPKLTLSMVVKNEADRYLAEALALHRQFIDEAVIIDDGSTDGTIDLIQRALEGIPLQLYRNTSSRFHNEIDLRKQQWQAAIASNPDWLLILDADEVFEQRAARTFRQQIQQIDFQVIGFRLYDFRDDTHYRDDKWWCAHNSYRPFMLRYTPDFHYLWKETAQHCGRMPANVLELNSAASDLRLRHMGWANAAERQRKYERYQQLDPDARFGIREQYDSILDAHPPLVEWKESQ